MSWGSSLSSLHNSIDYSPLRQQVQLTHQQDPVHHGRILWSSRMQTLWLFSAIIQTLQCFYRPLYTFISSTYDSSSHKWCLTSHKRLKIPSSPTSSPGENTVYRMYTFTNIVASFDCRNCSKTAGKVWELSLSPLRYSTLCLLCEGVISLWIYPDGFWYFSVWYGFFPLRGLGSILQISLTTEIIFCTFRPVVSAAATL